MPEGVVVGVAQHLPVLGAGLVIFPQLGELVAHEIQLFAGVRRHVQVQHPRLREFALVTAAHLLHDGGLAVNILVMGKRQDVVLVPAVHHGKGQLAEVFFAFLRGFFEVIQRIIHPAQVPLVVKAQTAVLHRRGDFGIIGGILRDEHRRGVALLQALVHPLQKLQRGTVHAAGRVALPVDEPGDRVHAQTVKVEHPQPVIGAGLQKGADLPAGMHEIAAAPLALPHRGGGVFVQRGAVKVVQAVGVHRKMHRHKIQQHPHARLMAGVHQPAQSLRRAVTAGGCVKAGGLVAPAAVKGVLRQRHQLDVGVAVVLCVGGQRGRQRVIVRVGALPAAQLHLVNIHRFIKVFGAARHPCPVLEAVGGQSRHHAAAIGAQRHGKAVGVAVVHAAAVRAHHPVLIAGARRGGDSALPDGGGVRPAGHGIFRPAAIGAVAGDQPHLTRRGRPHREPGAVRAGVRAEIVVGVKTFAGVKCLQVHRMPPFFEHLVQIIAQETGWGNSQFYTGCSKNKACPPWQAGRLSGAL